jgi:hypothetical protein
MLECLQLGTYCLSFGNAENIGRVTLANLPFDAVAALRGRRG